MASRSAHAQVLVALADPTRRAVLEAVRNRPMAVGEIADGLPISRPAVSQHLRVLEKARLVRCEREGTRRIYSVEPRGLLELQRYLQTYWGDALRAFRDAAQKEHERTKGRKA
jgi:DNA-binding transcriptional ArsR family regulator